jgi:hypothetical protein
MEVINMKKSLWLIVLAILLLPVFSFAYPEAYPLIQTDKDTYSYGEDIKVHFSDAPGYSGDWICVAPQGSPDTYAGDYKYMSNGLVEGVMMFKSPQPGHYEVRAYYNYSPFRYIVSARYPFTVAQEEYGYIDGGYYEPPITYSEPCYYTPPIIVTFGFDYFTYELSGRYVDIVFWRGGHPFHRRPWHDRGRRVTPDYIHSGRWHHKIPADDLWRHRDRLKEHHNVFHPDSYYGIKPDAKRKPEQGSSVTGKGPRPATKQIPKEFKPRQWERKTSQQTPDKHVWGQQSSGSKSSRQIPNNQVTGQPSSQTEHKTGSKRGQSQEKDKKWEGSSGQTEHKTGSNREQSREKDNHSQSGWGGQSQQSDSHSSSGSRWGGNSSGNSEKQETSREKHSEKKDR